MSRRKQELSRLVSGWNRYKRLWATYERTLNPEDYGEARRWWRQLANEIDVYAKRYRHGRPDGMGRAIVVAEIADAAHQMTLQIVD